MGGFLYQMAVNVFFACYFNTEPPQLDAGEVTDKGNLNQSNILKRRAEKIAELYQKQTENSLIIRIPTLNN